MRSLFSPNIVFILATYLFLSFVPFFPFLFGKDVDQWTTIFAIELVCWFALWALFKRPAYFHWLLLPAFLLLPVELYLQSYYFQGISPHHLGIILETSPKESLEFLGNRVWLLGGVLLGVLFWWWLAWRATWRTRALELPLAFYLVALLLLLGSVTTWLYGREVGIVEAPAAESADALASASISDAGAVSMAPASASLYGEGKWARFPKLPVWADITPYMTSFSQSWPLGFSAHAYEVWEERKYLSELKEKSKDFRFGSYQTDGIDEPQTVVLVIGESSRFDRWSLNGYERETNPLLRTEANLVSLSNVVSAVAATRLAVPVLVSRKPAIKSLIAGFSEKSILSAFKEAGFKTYWLSNQMTFGQFDTPVSVFANEADVTQFLNLGGYTNSSNYDEVLLEPFKLALADPAPKKMIVLHTLGNHWNYSHRYPPEFDRWKPSLAGVVNPAYTDLKLKPDLNNSYDNSILYTDWILSQLIASLRATNALSSMMYISDHGQTLYDGACTLAFHGHNTQFEFHVPALVWYSDLYKSIYPQKVERLRRNRAAKLSTENVFHSLLDMNDIRFPTEQLDRSFLSGKFKAHKRYVDSYGWSDYDNSDFKGDCREVIDRGKPLPQEK